MNKSKQKLDATKWWLLPYYRKDGATVVNDAGEAVDLMCAQAQDDHRFWDELHLEDDTMVRTRGGGWRYKSPGLVVMIRDCIVFAHNLRNGHCKEKFGRSVSEAIMIARIFMTKYPGD